MKALRPQKHLYRNVHSSFIHNSQKFQTAQVSINMRMDKQTINMFLYDIEHYSATKKLLISATWMNMKHKYTDYTYKGQN